MARITLPAGKTEHVVFDQDLGRFGFRIRASGSRSWVYQCEIGRRNRRVTIGSVSAVSPARARETANEMHAKARLGDRSGRGENREPHTDVSVRRRCEITWRISARI